MNSFVNDIFESIVAEASRLSCYTYKEVYHHLREAQTFVSVLLPGESCYSLKMFKT
ncbi:cleavage stage histone H2B-like [Tropilaelaps mercedesae]|uniref:Cleavage stage histone H2B-like n=1 Tax=Tropilaelaps mercedesae TaxID=418985 RepID=A0A1V9X947_9ACAR|nr:cleavage stage histone H2B-like [Tropilaelaps mercedesae]